jgi:hypothetical protein
LRSSNGGSGFLRKSINQSTKEIVQELGDDFGPVEAKETAKQLARYKDERRRKLLIWSGDPQRYSGCSNRHVKRHTTKMNDDVTTENFRGTAA